MPAAPRAGRKRSSGDGGGWPAVPSGPTPSVTVIIPVYNDAARLASCLQSLASQDYPGEVDVLVVDNGSSDHPNRALAGHPKVRLLDEARPGSYAARNRALAEARGAVLAFTDADCLPQPGWLSAGVRALLARPGIGLVGGPVELFPAGSDDARGLTLAETHEAVYGFPQEDYVRRGHFSATANLLTTRAVVERVGPFPEGVRSGGDQAWGRLVHAAGLEAVYEPAAVVRHPMRRELRELAAKTRRTVGGMHDRGEFQRYMASRFTFGRYVLKHYWGPLRQLPELRRRARERHVSATKLVAAVYYRQGVRAMELVRLRRGATSRR